MTQVRSIWMRILLTGSRENAIERLIRWQAPVWQVVGSRLLFVFAIAAAHEGARAADHQNATLRAPTRTLVRGSRRRC